MQINNQLNPASFYDPNLITDHTIFGNTKNNTSFPSSSNAPSCQNLSTAIEFENELLLPNHEDSNNENQDPNTKPASSQNNTIFLEDYITNEPVDFNSKKTSLKISLLILFLVELCLDTEQIEDRDSSSSLSRGSKKIAKFSPKQESPKRKLSKNSPKTDERNKGKKHPWQPAEDAKVLELVAQYGQSWAIIASSLGNRTGKQVRDRYLNYLRPDINEEEFTHQEDHLLLSLYYQLGHRWSKIASFMPGRTECQVKNRYYTVIKKKLVSPENNNEKRNLFNNSHHNELLQRYTKSGSQERANFEMNEEDMFREDENTITRESSAPYSNENNSVHHMTWNDPTDVIS